MSEEDKKETAPTLRGFLVEVFGALGEISARAEKAGKIVELETKLTEVESEKETRSRWWTEETAKTRKLEAELKEIKSKYGEL